jgi:hypothetical protein
MAIKISTLNTLSNDPDGDQEGQFRSANYGPVSSFPNSATEGDIGYANNKLYVFNGVGWVDFDGNSANQISGGTVLSPGDGYEYHVFTSNNNLTVSGSPDFEVDVLLVAGGGGGGAGRLGGGGGAGGVLQTLHHPIQPGTYPVVIGSGGSGMAYWNPPTFVEPPSAIATRGGNTTFDGLTASGGGAVGNRYNTGQNPGGSGAGGHPYSPLDGGSGVSGQGNSGGDTIFPGDSNPRAQYYYISAGGGGAGRGGGNTPNDGYYYNGDGGIGRSYESYGFNMPPSYGEQAPEEFDFKGEVYIAGGGGGAGGYPSINGVGGRGGGGNGYLNPGVTIDPSQHGSTYGAGGGGGAFNTIYNYGGGNGYQGIAIIRKHISSGKKVIATGGDHIYETSTDRYHVFLSPGTFVLNQDTFVNGLVVAGGGGGGSGDMGGGGGAGGAREFAVDKSTGDFSIVVGAGGAGGAEAWGDGYPSNPPLGPVNSYAGQNGYNGEDSSALGYTASGGGGGRCYNPTARLPGGSGGGGAWYGPSPTLTVSGGIGNTPSTSPPQGNPGGDGTLYKGGGGGGAGAAGSNSSQYPGGPAPSAGVSADGGSGKDMSSIFPSQVPFAKLAGGGSGGRSSTDLANQQGPQVGDVSYGGGMGGVGSLGANTQPVNPKRGQRMHFDRMPSVFPAQSTIGNVAGISPLITPYNTRFTLMNGNHGLVNTGGGGGGAGGYSVDPPSLLIRGKGGNGGSGIVILWYSKFPTAPTKATGGSIIKALGSTYHIFTTPGTFTTTETITNAEYLVVAGGGGGGTGTGGGGGAGGIRNGTSSFTGSFPVTVGDGAAQKTHGNAAANGSSSQLGPGIVATGGGRGVSGSPGGTVNTASPGGSGGGGGNYPLGMTSNRGDGIPGQGFPGGNYAGSGASGGGGAGGKGGGPGPGSLPGIGGDGKLYPAFPAQVIGPAIPSSDKSAFINAVGTGYYGGGGAGNQNISASGGLGGGGSVPGSPTPKDGTPGVNYTGGGGAGAWDYSAPAIGGGGGKGIVIVRYS